MPFWKLLILPVLLSDAPAAWPIDLPENGELSHEDLDRDGQPDERVQTSDGGSGWREFDTCVRHGATGHVACEQTASTACSLFSGERRVLVPPTGNRAEALLGPEDCAAPGSGRSDAGGDVGPADADPGRRAHDPDRPLAPGPPARPAERVPV